MSEFTMKSGNWFREPPQPRVSGPLSAAIKMLLGAAIGAVVFGYAKHLAVMIWVITAILGMLSLSSHRVRSRVDRFFAAVGQGLGWFLGILLLTPIYLLGFSLIHVISFLSRKDPLLLRDTDGPTFWLPADHDRRKVRYIRTLFATETRELKPRGRGLQFAVSAVLLLVAAEVSLRSLGFGDPILYVADRLTGYHPAPNQHVQRYGGRVATNRYGMRRPHFEIAKNPGTLRILMLGDSTLWGGSNVDQPDLYARRLEVALNQPFDHPRVEVLNMGVNGWGPFNKIGYVEAAGTFDADIAVICLPIEDIYRAFTVLSDMPYFTTKAPPRLALEELFGHLYWRTQIWMEEEKSAEQRLPQALAGIEAYVSLGRLLRGTGCEVLVEVLPSREAGTGSTTPDDERQAVDMLRSALEEHAFSVGFPQGLFAGQKSGRDVYRDRCHLQAVGHAIYADYLESRLRGGSSVFRTWATRPQVTQHTSERRPHEHPGH